MAHINKDPNAMTDMQKLADAIDGFNPLTNESGACCAAYGDFTRDGERLEYLDNYATNVLCIPLPFSQFARVNAYLQTDFVDSNERYHDFTELV